MQYYTLSDFHSISTKGFNVILPDTTVDLINNLSSLVGSPNYIKTPVFSKKEISYDNERRKRKDKHTKRGNDTSWTDKNKNNSNNSSNLDTTNSNIVFKSPSTTKKELTPVETYVKKIRTILNKVATNSDIDLLTPFTNILDEMLETDITCEEVTEVSEHITRIMLTNSFYSKDYSRIYSLLLKRYDFIKDSFENQYNMYLKSYQNVQDINPDEDYDLFCSINKGNDERRSITLFYTKMYYIHNMIDTEKILCLLGETVEMLYKNIDNSDTTYLNDELIENICIFIQKNNSNLFQLCKQTHIKNQDITIESFILKLSKSKPKQYKGLSTKSLFKIVETVEHLKK